MRVQNPEQAQAVCDASEAVGERDQGSRTGSLHQSPVEGRERTPGGAQQGAAVLQEGSIRDAAWAGRFAGLAAEATVDVSGERVRGGKLSLG